MAQQQNILQVQKLELQELNRVLKDIQQRLNDLQGFSGKVEIDAELEARGLVVTEIPQQEEVTLSEEGKIWFQPREGQAPEAQFQVTESTETDFGTIRRRLNVVQRAAQDGEDVGKASTFDFNSPLTALVDLDTDQVDVGVDADALLDVIDWDAAAELIDHGLLDGLGDDDHPQYLLADGTRIASLLQIDDAAFYLDIPVVGVPRLNFDTNDFIAYDRSGNEMNFYIGGANKGTFKSTGFAMASATTLSAAALTTSGDLSVTDASFILGIPVATQPRITFDTNDFYQYLRSTNVHEWYIGGTLGLYLSSSALVSAGTMNPGNLSNWYLGTTSSQPLLNFDSGDYATYQRTNNELELYIGSAKALGFKSKTIPLLTESHGGTIYNSGGIPNAALNIIVWRAPYACTVTNVRGYRVGGTGATVNARKNGSSTHLSSAVSLTNADTWTDGGAVQNTSYAAGDKLEIMVVSTTGTVTQLGIQVDFERA